MATLDGLEDTPNLKYAVYPCYLALIQPATRSTIEGLKKGKVKTSKGRREFTILVVGKSSSLCHLMEMLTVL